MATVKITNLSSSPVLIQEFYTIVNPGESLQTTRSPGEISDLTRIAELEATGAISVEITQSASELALAGAGSDTVVFDPNSRITKTANVYRDWEELMEVVDSIAAPTIFFAGDAGDAIPLPVGDWDMSNAKWVGPLNFNGGDNLLQICIEEGTTLPGLSWVEGLKIVNNCTATIPVVNPPGMFFTRWAQYGLGAGGQDGTGTVPFVQFSEGGSLKYIDVNDRAAVSNTGGGAPFAEILDGIVSIQVASGASLFASSIETNSGSATTVVACTNGSIDPSFDVGSNPSSSTFVNNFTRFVTNALRTSSTTVSAGEVERFDTTAGGLTATLEASPDRGGTAFVVNQAGANNVTVTSPIGGDDTLAPGEYAQYIATADGWLRVG